LFELPLFQQCVLAFSWGQKRRRKEEEEEDEPWNLLTVYLVLCTALGSPPPSILKGVPSEII
jgi:hypothetical protein